MKKTGHFLIVEQREYSDYPMYFIQVPDGCLLGESDISFLLSLDSSDNPTITGHIWGEIDYRVEDLKKRAETEINSMCCCFDNRPYQTVVDRLHSMEDLLLIVTTNDSSGYDYWEREIYKIYSKYVKAFNLYKQL